MSERGGTPVTRRAYVVEADVRLPDDADPAILGTTVTTALCGAATHAGPCRWPHHNDHERVGQRIRFRTLFVVDPKDEPEVRRRIETALRSDEEEFTVIATRTRDVAPSERELAQRLSRTPRPT